MSETRREPVSVEVVRTVSHDDYVCNVIPLETRCGFCDGSGSGEFRKCGCCDGSGVQLTEQGRAVLDFVVRHLKSRDSNVLVARTDL